MENLTANLNESCILGTLRNNKRYILHVVNSTQEVQVQVRTERNVYETASGRLLIAYLTEKELERFLQQNGLPERSVWKEAITHKNLLQELAKIKKEGLAATHVSNRHVRGFAVPVFADGKVVAGLSVFLPDYRCTPSKQRTIIQSLRLASEEISSGLV